MAISESSPPGQPVFQLRIELSDVDPPIWRRIVVPGSVRMSKLYHMLQAAMGWTNSHLHCFEVGGVRYGMQFDDYPEGELEESAVTVLAALRHHDSFTYKYDFGDCWEHDVMIERSPGGSAAERLDWRAVRSGRV